MNIETFPESLSSAANNIHIKESTLLLLNGSSGAGKTTIATLLSEMDGVEWIHPDGLWDPSMDQREATFKAVALAVSQHQAANIVVIDKQFRHQFMLDAFAEYGVTAGKQILLYCNSADRRHRLEQRGWNEADIAIMEDWAQWLYKDSGAAGNVAINTSIYRTDEVVSFIRHHFSKWEWINGVSQL